MTKKNKKKLSKNDIFNVFRGVFCSKKPSRRFPCQFFCKDSGGRENVEARAQ